VAWNEERRYGEPRSEEERRQRHYELYGEEELPPRRYGQGLVAQDTGGSKTGLWLLLGVGGMIALLALWPRTGN
jgi:hypothetical protein